MNLFGLLVIAIGIFSICGAAFDWDFFLNNYKARFFVTILGRTGARMFYGIFGLVIVIVGALTTVGVME